MRTKVMFAMRRARPSGCRARRDRRRRLRRTRAQRRHGAEPRRVLDAARGLREAHSHVPEDCRGRRTSTSRSRTARPASRRGPSRPASTPTSSRSRSLPTSTSSSPRHRRREVEEAVVQGHGHELGRRLRRARRQPEEDQELERPPSPGCRGRHAEPVHVGWCALERHGRVRRLEEGRQDRQAGAGEPPEALQERRRPGHERTCIAERPSTAARATSSSRTRTRRTSPARRA